VDTSSLSRLQADFLRARTEKWGAVVSSVGAAVAYILLLLLLYLFVDLLVWRGRVPGYAELTPAKQRAFAEEWGSRDVAARMDALRRAAPGEDTTVLLGGDRVPPPTAAQWEQRWRAGVYLALRDRVNQDAADAYLPEDSEPTAVPRELGVLSLVARERNRWTGVLLGSLASWNGWMWRPGETRGENLTYLTGLLILAFTIGVARGLFMNAMIYLAAVVRLDLVTRLRRAIYLHTYRLGSLTVRTGGSAEPVQLFTRHAEAVGDAVHSTLTTTFRSPIMILGLLILILLVNFWLAVSCLLLAALVWLVTGQIAAHFRREARLGSRQGESSLALLVESLSLLRLVKCYQMERFNQTRVERQLAESGRAAWYRLRGEALSRPLLGAVALLAGVALLYPRAARCWRVSSRSRASC
jgi:ATP-binding cassette subfamily B protein